MKFSHIAISLLASNVCTQVNAHALLSEQVAHCQLVCEKGLYSHERRLFDALAHSDLIDWTLIKAGEQVSRINYTRTAGINDADVVHCDAVIEYTYENKKVAIKTGYTVAPQYEHVACDLIALDRAVHDFIIQLMV